MLSDGQLYFRAARTVLSVNLVADAVRDVLGRRIRRA